MFTIIEIDTETDASKRDDVAQMAEDLLHETEQAPDGARQSHSQPTEHKAPPASGR